MEAASVFQIEPKRRKGVGVQRKRLTPFGNRPFLPRLAETAALLRQESNLT
jgi:hypothetical protein